jgi:hypothetical protein
MPCTIEVRETRTTELVQARKTSLSLSLSFLSRRSTLVLVREILFVVKDVAFAFRSPFFTRS